MADKAQGKPPSSLSNDPSLLGFNLLVAPSNETAKFASPLSPGSGGPGSLYKLFQSKHGTNKVAPDQHAIVRKILQTQQVQNKIIELYTEKIPSLQRYNQEFK